MSYPTPPAERLAYDIDGTVGIISGTRGVEFYPRVLNQEAMTALNSETRPVFSIDVMGSSGPRFDPRDEFYGNVPWYQTNVVFQSNVFQEALNWIVLVFPRLTNIDAVFAAALVTSIDPSGTASSEAYFQPILLQVSDDTTNGQDGTWTTVLTLNENTTDGYGYGAGASSSPNDTTITWPDTVTSRPAASTMPSYDDALRDGDVHPLGYGWKRIGAGAANSVRALKLTYSQQMGPSNVIRGDSNPPDGWDQIVHKLHVYGSPAAGASIHRLEFVTPTEEPMSFNWGDVQNGQTYIKQFKIRNLSDTFTAENIDLNCIAAASSNTPAPHQAIEFSLNGTTWSPSLVLSSIAPKSVSALIYVRLAVPAESIGGFFAPRIMAEVGGWV